MKIVVVDDELPALKATVDAVKNVQPDAEIYQFRDALKALAEIENGLNPDVIFSDVRMYDMTGIQFAHRLKTIYPKSNIIFITGYSEYMQDAFRLHASGYLLKPVDEEQLAEQLNNLLYPIKSSGQGFYAQTFGNFEFFSNGKIVHFPRAKSKELLAYLIDKKGSACTRQELLVNLFEEDTSESANQYLSQAFFVLMKTLKEIGAEKIILKSRSSYAVDTSKFECDYYKYLDGDVGAINQYQGLYMTNYSSWSDFCGPKRI